MKIKGIDSLLISVSYTHLDVYKRQDRHCAYIWTLISDTRSGRRRYADNNFYIFESKIPEQY